MYALIDCNNFYCSCERVFNPALVGKPVVVLSNNDGCVISRSEEAKQLGIKMATPAFMIESLFKKEKVAVFSSNYTLYGDMSRRVMEIISSFVPSIEIYSIDEAFADLTSLSRCNPLLLGLRIRHAILMQTGIPVTVGIGSTKTLAKMSNRHAKKVAEKEGIFWASSPMLIDNMLRETKVADIWGIGKQYALLLNNAGFTCAADFVQASDDWVRINLSVVGLRLLFELRGSASIEFEDSAPARQQVCTSRSFGKRLGDKAEIAEALANYAAIVASKLRHDKTCCRSVNVFIQTDKHKRGELQYNNSIDIDLERPTNHTSEIIKISLKGLDLIFKPGFLYIKCGISASDVVPEDCIQQEMFESGNQSRNKKIMNVLDSVNLAFGKERVRMASQGFEKRYRLRAEKLSGCFTTRLDQVLRISNG